VSPFPEGYHRITPYLVVDGAARAIDFYSKHFGAVEFVRMPGPNGAVMHAEMKVGDSVFMLADQFPEMGFKAPGAFGGSPVSLLLYVEDVDDVVKKAVEAGATLLRPVENQFYGDRAGTLADPFGHIWTVATHVEDVTPEEMQRRMEKMGG
jgi:PhnB protein